MEKWSKVFENTRAINEFIDFLNEKNVSIAKTTTDEYLLIPLSTHEIDMLIYECYDIDPVKLENERRELLKRIKP